MVHLLKFEADNGLFVENLRKALGDRFTKRSGTEREICPCASKQIDGPVFQGFCIFMYVVDVLWAPQLEWAQSKRSAVVGACGLSWSIDAVAHTQTLQPFVRFLNPASD